MSDDPIRLWVEDLESEQHDQGYGHLHTRDEQGTDLYCCLGRLCELAIENGIDLGVDVRSDAYAHQVFMYNGISSYLPSSVEHWAGLGHGPNQRRPERYAELNDSGRSFKEIATTIREDFGL